jgi:Zn-dependent protease with chaperone function
MEEKQFVELVERLESYSRLHPRAYKVRVALLAVLGYVVLFAVVALVAALVVAVVVYGWINFLVIKLLWIPLGIAALILRSLWIKFPEPDGQELAYADAPKLFDLVEEVRAAVSAPYVHRTFLTDDFNAGVMQRPRLGILGWQENYLVIGLPLLEALSKADLRAILAHEFGHISDNHGSFTSWVYRVRQAWVRVLTLMKQEKKQGVAILESFFNWYAPYFGAYSFVLARAQEYEADRCAVGLSGRECFARALVRVELKGRMIEQDFWPELSRLAETQPEPPARPFGAFIEAIRKPLPRESAAIWFSESLTAKHDVDDTHPALADRLSAIGYSLSQDDPDPALIDIEETEPREKLLELPLETFVSKNDRLLRERMLTGWRERHKFFRKAQQELVLLEKKEGTAPLTLEEQWERARFLAGTKGFEAAEPLLHEILKVQQDHAGAKYVLGRALLDKGDGAGVSHLELAMKLDLSTVPAGCQLIHSFMMAQQRPEEAGHYRNRVNAHNAMLKEANEERKAISPFDKYGPHRLSYEVVEEIKSQLSTIAPLKAAFLVRKEVRYFPEQPCFVLGIVGEYPFYRRKHLRADRALVSRVVSEVKFPGRTLVLALEGTNKQLRKVFGELEGSEIYWT